MRILVWTILLATAMLGPGCVEREMEITTDPPGALVFVSDVEVGRSPIDAPFTWYGDYDIICRMDGYETLTTHRNLLPPVYEIPPLDLLSALAPWTYHDRRYLHFELTPLVLPDDEELIERAEQMEAETLEIVGH